MIKTRFTIVFLLFSLSVSGKEVPVEIARAAATGFLTQHQTTALKTNVHFELTRVLYSTAAGFNQRIKKSASGDPEYYIFNINDNDGFIIVSGDDLATPILGYSFQGHFDGSNAPVNLRKWMESYKNQIRYLRTIPEEALSETKEVWMQLLSGRSTSSSNSTTTVDPLIATKWDQGTYYNERCPYDKENGQYSATGCVATAMAQILKYWNYPETGNGFHSYNHSSMGVISANFGSTRYRWSEMPDELTGTNNAVATLMFHCGVSVEMSYSAPGSYAYVVSDASPVEHCSEFAFKEYFGYDGSLQGIQRKNYTYEAWIQLLKSELEDGRPVEYVGFGTGGGHAFVCDGYDANDFFHFNWGWGGYYDGYFALDAMNPTATGIGGGTGEYNSGQQAIIGIKPPGSNMEYDLRLYDGLTISDTLLFFIDSFNIHTDIGNYGELTFTGDFCAAIFDEEFNFIEYADIIEGAVLEGGMHYKNGVDFSNPGSVSLLPGKYVFAVFYRPTGENWKIVGDGVYENLLAFEVYYASDIELYNDFVISTGTKIIQNRPFTVMTDILNDGSSTFKGDFDISLYDMEGEFATTIETRPVDSLRANYYFSEYLFSSEGVSLKPGTYLMALLHRPEGESWILAGSSYYTNPVKVIVAEASLVADRYENNDSEENPYVLQPVFSENGATILTEGSNSHVGTDLDYYKLELEKGFNYSISARAHDSYNSAYQEEYTNDVIWSYRTSGLWSEVYDDVMAGNIYLAGGGQVLFGVAPYYEGETGTYLFEIVISREESLSFEEFEESSLVVYPVPVNDILFIEASEKIDGTQLYDANGRMIRVAGANNVHTFIDVSNLPGGIYFLRVIQEDQTAIRKIIVQ